MVLNNRQSLNCSLLVLLLNENVVIISDLNIPHCVDDNSRCPKRLAVTNFCDDNQLLQTNSLLNSYDRMLDLIFINFNFDLTVSGAIHQSSLSYKINSRLH